MRNKIITVIFCAALLFGIGISVAVPDKEYSENEKRELAQIPEINPENFISGKTSDDIENYLTDQFPMRDNWITVKTLSEISVGKREAGGVYFSDDGYIIETFKTYNTKQAKTNISALKNLSDTLQSKYQIKLKVMLVPTATEILEDKLPLFAPHASQKNILDYAKKQGLDIIDTTEILKEHKDEYLYYKTDHHYTSLGAYYCYKQWMENCGKQAEPLSVWKSEILCNDFRGTTYSKVNYPFAPFDTITAYYKSEKHHVNYNNGAYVTDSIYERTFLEGKDQYAVFFNSNQPLTVVSGNGTGKLLILKDSYANTFGQFIIDDYEETHLIDLRFFKKSVEKYIAENEIDEVLVLYNIPNFVEDAGIARCTR